MTWLVIGFFVCAGVTAAVILRGWVLAHLWSWFAVPVFHVPELAISQAIGISMIVYFLTNSSSNEKYAGDSSAERVAKALAVVLIGPLFALLVGWIVKGYLP